MKKRFSNFGMSTILVVFAMMCIVTFSVLAFITANSDYKLSCRVAENNSSYYQKCVEINNEIAEIDQILYSAYTSTSSRKDYFNTAASMLSDENGSLTQDDTSTTFDISRQITDKQSLYVTLEIIYPSHQKDNFYKIKKWQLTTDTSLVDDDSLNLIGGN